MYRRSRVPLLKSGPVVQLVRAPACHAGSCGFESRPVRSSPNSKVYGSDRSLFVFWTCAGVAELVDAGDLKSPELNTRAGSIPASSTLPPSSPAHSPFL